MDSCMKQRPSLEQQPEEAYDKIAKLMTQSVLNRPKHVPKLPLKDICDFFI
jgi:hypothetical protein